MLVSPEANHYLEAVFFFNFISRNRTETAAGDQKFALELQLKADFAGMVNTILLICK